MHRHGLVGEYRLGAYRRDLDGAASVDRSALELVRERVELARAVLAIDLEVRERRLARRIPLHDPLTAIEDATMVELHELLAHGARQPFVHREPSA